MSLIQSVTGVKAHILPAKPLPQLMSVAATGMVPTTGWTHPSLSPRFYIVPPADGLWDFDFIADEPTGIVGNVVLPVSALAMHQAPSWLQRRPDPFRVQRDGSEVRANGSRRKCSSRGNFQSPDCRQRDRSP